MKQYNVTGMSCAACSARVEKAVGKVPGVTACSVSLLTNSMGVEGTAEPSAVIAAVEEAGYGASEKGAAQSSPSADEQQLEDHETPRIRRRLLWSVGFLLVLMYFSMGHMMWGWPLPPFYDNNHVAMGLTQLLLTVIIMSSTRSSSSAAIRPCGTGLPIWTPWWPWGPRRPSATAPMPCSP